MPVLRATLSILGLYHQDNTIFDNLVLPEDVSKDILISNLLSELAELEILYPDTDYMKGIIGMWSQKELPKWQYLMDTLDIAYDPINNYSKHTIHHGTDELHTLDTSLTTDETHTSDTGSNTTTTSVKGYNETSFVDSDQTVTSTGDTGSKIVTNNKSDTGSKMDTKDFDRTVTGNVGIYSFSKLIQEEMDLREKYNIYDLIIKDFKLRFCILVY